MDLLFPLFTAGLILFKLEFASSISALEFRPLSQGRVLRAEVLSPFGFRSESLLLLSKKAQVTASSFFYEKFLWGTKDEIQSIPPFKWFSLLLVPVPNSSPVCSQVPVIVIRLLEPRGLSIETSTNNRRFLMVFPLLTAALSTPLDIWCQIVACFFISLIIEFAIFVASIVQVHEEGWTSGMRESGVIGVSYSTLEVSESRSARTEPSFLLHWIEFTYALPSSSQGFGTYYK
nr:trimethylamine methyltransferase [Ipomoea batatas]